MFRVSIRKNRIMITLSKNLLTSRSNGYSKILTIERSRVQIPSFYGGHDFAPTMTRLALNRLQILIVGREKIAIIRENCKKNKIWIKVRILFLSRHRLAICHVFKARVYFFSKKWSFYAILLHRLLCLFISLCAKSLPSILYGVSSKKATSFY